MLFLSPADVRGIDGRALEAHLERRELVVAYGDGEVRGSSAAALLFADYAVLHQEASLTIDVPEAWAAVVWRLGRSALRWYARGGETHEVVDEVTELGPASWLEKWTSQRSVIALDSAACLIRSRGGDALERAEFARLFAIGEPQKGLAAFLEKRRPVF
jgi:hypothetical protein